METKKNFPRRKAPMWARLKATKQRVRVIQSRVNELERELQLTRVMRDIYKESYDFAMSLNDKYNGRFDKIISLLEKPQCKVTELKE